MTDTTITTREAEDPHERAAVRRGWQDVQHLEDLREGAARRLFAHRWDAERARAKEWFVSPPDEGLLGSFRAMYESPSNITRFRRTLDFITPGESVFEVGTGKGFLATLLLRDGQVGGYRGGELVPAYARTTRELLGVNGFGDRADVTELDLYDLSRERVGDSDLVICCEVIEHVPDAEAALRALADALPDGADLLFSTPLLGRLEGIWGHTAIFGVERLRAMIESAGLVAHHVEAVDNTWVLVLASRGTAPSPRARAAAAAVTDPTAVQERDPYRARRVTNVDPHDLEQVKSIWNKRMDLGTEHVVSEDEELGDVRGLRITGTPRPDRTGPQYFGLAFPIPPEHRPTLGVRLELEVPHPEQVEKISVEFTRDGEAVARWSWKPQEHRPKRARPTFVLREGSKGTYFTPSPVDGDIRTADRVEIYGAVTKGHELDFSLLRWGWIS